MALVHCFECEREISDLAASCPGCGAPLRESLGLWSKSLDATTSRLPMVRPVFVVALLLVALPFFAIWRAFTSDSAAPVTAGLLGLIRQPMKVVEKKVELEEGMSHIYSFTLPSDARVQVQLSADPRPVDLLLMTAEDATKFRAASSKLFGGKYAYRQALSSKHVLQMDETEKLPAGDWAIVVARPQEAVLFGERTIADISVTAY